MKTFGLLAAGCISLAAISGCQSGEVSDQRQTQDKSPDGKTATQTRTQMRTAPSGTQVRETETRTREVVQPSTRAADATQTDPGMPKPR